MEEQWKDVAGYEGLYEVSSLGRVRTLQSSPRLKSGECLSGGNTRGYRTVILCKGGKKTAMLVHRLVAFAFLGAPPDCHRPTVNHKNLEKADNRTENLEWMAHADNNRHAAPLIPHQKGTERPDAKLTEDDVRSIRARYIPHQVTLNQLAKEFGVSNPTIHAIIHRRKWSHID